MWQEWLWILHYAKQYKLEILFYIASGIIGTIVGLGSSIASKYLIDIVTGNNTSSVVIMAVAMISLSVFGILFQNLCSRISAKIGIRIQNDIQADIFDQIIDVDWLELSKYHSGDLLNRFSSDIGTVAGSAIGWVPNLITTSFQFLATLAVICYYDVTMAVIALANAPIMLLSSRFLMSRMRQYNKQLKTIGSEMMGFEAEAFYNIDSIKSFGLTRLFSKKLRSQQKHFKEVTLQYNQFSILTNICLSLIGLLVEYSCFGWGVYRLWSGAIIYGTFTLFLTQANNLSSSFSSLISIVPSTVGATISAGRIIEIINLPKEKTDPIESDKLRSTAPKGFSIVLKNASFSYVEDKQVLVSSCLEANPGEIVALVGPSGEGKTTLIRMFLGLITPNSGEAKIIDHNGYEVTLNSATRQFFSYVPQGNTIFSGSIADNLRMVKEDATDEEIIEALTIACAYDFVKELPDGINSELGERGMGFSEGQAQRIAIARAILRDAPVLLLDEATSALDVATERKVLKNIILQKPNKTCIVTTHRPSVLNMCQRVYRILDTRLTELSEEESSQMAMDF
ncbi:MAG: ABC transporter ATP-binding protein [Lachnospiraceae bacterium]|nr:ABC transporter ATP-binding protein [Lachnospiraceae bacterium]